MKIIFTNTEAEKIIKKYVMESGAVPDGSEVEDIRIPHGEYEVRIEEKEVESDG